jgi:hypothetical protein
MESEGHGVVVEQAATRPRRVGVCGFVRVAEGKRKAAPILLREGAAPISHERVLSMHGAQAQSSRRRGRQGIHMVV